MKNQKQSLSLLGRSVRDDPGVSSPVFEHVQVCESERNDKCVVIIDFNDCTATTKTLIDLDVAATVTKSIEPFFLDCKSEQNLFLTYFKTSSQWKPLFLGRLNKNEPTFKYWRKQSVGLIKHRIPFDGFTEPSAYAQPQANGLHDKQK